MEQKAEKRTRAKDLFALAIDEFMLPLRPKENQPVGLKTLARAAKSVDPSGHLGKDIARLNAQMNWSKAMETKAAATHRELPPELLNIPRDKLWFRAVSRAHKRSNFMEMADDAEGMSGDLAFNRARARWLRAAAMIVAYGYKDTAPVIGAKARGDARRPETLLNLLSPHRGASQKLTSLSGRFALLSSRSVSQGRWQKAKVKAFAQEDKRTKNKQRWRKGAAQAGTAGVCADSRAVWPPSAHISHSCFCSLLR